jgi:hypothetical protein
MASGSDDREAPSEEQPELSFSWEEAGPERPEPFFERDAVPERTEPLVEREAVPERTEPLVEREAVPERTEPLVVREAVPERPEPLVVREAVPERPEPFFERRRGLGVPFALLLGCVAAAAGLLSFEGPPATSEATAPDARAASLPPTPPTALRDLAGAPEPDAEIPAAPAWETPDRAVSAAPPPREPRAALAPAAVAPRSDPADGAFFVQLLAGRSEAAALGEWPRLRESNPELADLSPRVVRAELGARGVFYRLRAGPLESEEQARRICFALGTRGQSCFVARVEQD